MIELGPQEDCRISFSIAFASKREPDNHTIDAEALAPSLVATSRFLRELNKCINGKAVSCQINITSDFEHKCFNINYEFVTSIIDGIEPIIESERVKTAKEILEWAGIIGGATGLSGFSLIKFLQWKKGRKISKVETANKVGENAVNVTVDGDGNSVTINRNVYIASENPNVVKNARDIFTPIDGNAFDEVEIREGGKLTTTLTAKDVNDIIQSCNSAIADNDNAEDTVETLTAWLSVYSPVFDISADKWRFRFGADHIYADISETDIAKQAVDRGVTTIDDSYQVILEIRTQKNGSKKQKPSYKIIKVLKFSPGSPATQGNLI